MRVSENIFFKLFITTKYRNITISSKEKHSFTILVVSQDATQIIIEVCAKDGESAILQQILRGLIEVIFGYVRDYLRKVAFNKDFILGEIKIHIVNYILSWVNDFSHNGLLFNLDWYNLVFISVLNVILRLRFGYFIGGMLCWIIKQLIVDPSIILCKW